MIPTWNDVIILACQRMVASPSISVIQYCSTSVCHFLPDLGFPELCWPAFWLGGEFGTLLRLARVDFVWEIEMFLLLEVVASSL